MNPLASWENILLGVIAIAIVFMFFPGVKTMLKQSQEAEKDWPGFVLPIGAVILFVIFLVYTLR